MFEMTFCPIYYEITSDLELLNLSSFTINQKIVKLALVSKQEYPPNGQTIQKIYVCNLWLDL